MNETKTITPPAVVDAPEDIRDERFGWVWMDPTGHICGCCREEQPQSKPRCVEMHSAGLAGDHEKLLGIPIPWMLAA